MEGKDFRSVSKAKTDSRISDVKIYRLRPSVCF